jgi:acetoin utilization protein AcuB
VLVAPAMPMTAGGQGPTRAVTAAHDEERSGERALHGSKLGAGFGFLLLATPRHDDCYPHGQVTLTVWSTMVVQEIMTRRPSVVELNESIGCARAKLRDADIRHLPVVDRGVLVGIISGRDIPEFDVDSDGSLLLEARYAMNQPASSIMSRNLVLGTPESELTEVIDLMLEHKIGALPIVAPGTLDLLGIVSYVDVLKAARARV